MNIKILSILLIGIAVLTACASPAQTAPTPTLLVFMTPTLPAAPGSSQLTASPGAAQPTANPLTTAPALTVTSSAPANLCADPQATALIDSLKTAVNNADGPLLAALVSPTNGMDVAFFHNGTVINYDQAHAKFVFETTYQADWGPHPASGQEKIGSFHEVVVPELKNSFAQAYTLHCNELKHGGASYPVTFPYNKGFYSIYFPGTDANGNMDWHTWVVGIEYVNGKPYIYALIQFFWEP